MKNKIHQGNLALARRIRAAGLPIYIGEDDGEASHDPSRGLFIYKDGVRSESCAFDFYDTAGFVINVVITVNVPHFAISGFGLELPWNSYVRWLDDPGEIDGRTAVYRFSEYYFLEFERNKVLNHLADMQRMWSRGKSFRGYLLGIGSEPIPDEFQQGAMIPAFLIVYDQFSREYRSPISLWRDRTQKPVSRARSWRPRRGGLLDRRDPLACG